MDLYALKSKLQQAGVVFDDGLMDCEVRLAEESFGFQFPSDLKALLMFALPTGQGWPDWRDVEDPQIKQMLNAPYEGICFEIEHNAFWPASWGFKPRSLTESFDVARRKIDAAPKLIPILAHRYLPDRPLLEGNPVFSVHQTDVIYYGSNLWNYFQNEFHDSFGSAEYEINDPPRRIEFWSDLVDDNC